MQSERHHMRQYLIDTWQKREQKERLSPLECQLLAIIEQHPEYQQLLDNPQVLDKDYSSDNNPFLHINLHMGLLEQLTTDRPAGIRELYQQLFEKFGDEHQVQHMMMGIMGEIIWDAQQNQQLPDEQVYLERLKELI